MKRLIFLLTFSIPLVLFNSCKKDHTGPEDDPITGRWHLVAITANGQSGDVSNQDCFRDSYLDINSNTLTLFLSAPQADGTCASDSASSEWLREDGKYYTIENGEKKDAGVQLLDENKTLQITVTIEGQHVIMSFRR